MNKKFITLAMAAAMAAPMAVSADAVLYGKVRMAVESYDNGSDTIAEIKSHSSRIGVKGSEDLGDGLKAVYTLEFGVDIAGKQAHEFSANNPMSARNAFVGLAGNWGTLLVGRHDTPTKISTGALDYFGDQAGDFNYGPSGNFTLDLRADGTIAYITPSMGGLTIAAAIVPGENAAADGLADAYSVAAMYGNSGFYLSAAVEGADGATDVIGDPANDLTQTRVGLGYDSGSWKIGGVWANIDLDSAGDADYYHVNAAYKFGNNTVKAKYFDSELMAYANGSTGVDGFALGFDHAFSKRTDLNLTYVDNDIDQSVWGVGLNHSF